MARHPGDFIGERRSAYFGFQLTPSERRNLERRAEQNGMLLAEYVRQYLPLGVPRRNRRQAQRSLDGTALIGELGRIGNNLNQLAKHANQTSRMPDEALLRSAIDELKSVFSRIV